MAFMAVVGALLMHVAVVFGMSLPITVIMGLAGIE